MDKRQGCGERLDKRQEEERGWVKRQGGGERLGKETGRRKEVG